MSPQQDPHQAIRDGVRDLCAQFPDEYHRQIDEARVAEASLLSSLADETPDEYRGRIVEALASDPDRYYQRTTIVRLEGEQARHLEELRAEVRELASAAPIGNPDACVRYGATCGFFPACSGERRIEEYMQIRWPHPELAEDK